MSDREKQFKNHPIHEFIGQLRSYIRINTRDISTDHRSIRRRFSRNLRFIEDALNLMNPDFFSANDVNRLYADLKNSGILKVMDFYHSSRDFDGLTHAYEMLVKCSLSFFQKVGAKNISQIKKFINENKSSGTKNEIDANAELRKVIKELEEKTNAIDKLEERITVLSETAANYAIPELYNKNAAEDKNSAILWRRISVGLYSLALGWLLLNSGVSIPILKDVISIDKIFIENNGDRFLAFVKIAGFTGVVLIMAKFASNQSRLHRQHWNNLLWHLMDTNEIGQFASSLPDDVSQDTKDKIIQTVFGKDRNSANENTKKSDGTIKEIIDAIKKVFDGTKGG